MNSATGLVSVLTCLGFVVPTGMAAPSDPLKVFISVDMEGVSGVVDRDQTSATGHDYERFRKLDRTRRRQTPRSTEPAMPGPRTYWSTTRTAVIAIS